MALQEDMQVLVGDLEAASARRTRDESERHAVAASDARDRMAVVAGMRIELAEALGMFRRERVMQAAQDARGRAEAEHERQAMAAQDARDRGASDYQRYGAAVADTRQRASDIASRSVDVTQTLSEFQRERFMQAAHDSRARAEAEHERQAIAAQDAGARAAVALELRKIGAFTPQGREALGECPERGVCGRCCRCFGYHVGSAAGFRGDSLCRAGE